MAEGHTDEIIITEHQRYFDDIFKRLRDVDRNSKDISHLQGSYTIIIGKIERIERMLVNRLPGCCSNFDF